MEFSGGLEQFLDYLKEMDELYRMASADELEADKATQDILHCLELEEHTYHETARLGRKLTEVRQQRRVAKDKVLQLQPLHEWAAGNAKVIGGLQQVLGAVRKEERKIGARVYIPRTEVTKQI